MVAERKGRFSACVKARGIINRATVEADRALGEMTTAATEECDTDISGGPGLGVLTTLSHERQSDKLAQ